MNPEFGTLADFRRFVGRAHELGMHVIIDWVGNHTSWDNVLRTSHPDWYVRDGDGKPQPTPWYDRDDIVDLDYGKPGLRRARGCHRGHPRPLVKFRAAPDAHARGA